MAQLVLTWCICEYDIDFDMSISHLLCDKKRDYVPNFFWKNVNDKDQIEKNKYYRRD